MTFTRTDAPSASRAAVGALAGAFAVALVYGALGRALGESSSIAFLIGAGAGVGAAKLGGEPSALAGGIAAVVALVAVVFAKAIVGAPPEIGWLDHHTQPFDLVFCFFAPAAFAFALASTERASRLLDRVPV